jgi:hypothetical protein
LPSSGGPDASTGVVIDALARFAADRRALWLLSAWAAAEALVLPIVPDVGLALLVLAAPARAVPLYAAVVAGAVGGSLVMHALAAADPSAVERLLLAIPGIDGFVLAVVDDRIAADGIAAFAQVGPGPPLKAWTAGWTEAGGDGVGSAVGAVLNRLTRIGPVVAGAWVAGRVGADWLRRNDRVVVGLYAALWVLAYVAILA